jgi:hypothetical protein
MRGFSVASARWGPMVTGEMRDSPSVMTACRFRRGVAAAVAVAVAVAVPVAVDAASTTWQRQGKEEKKK